MSVHSEETTLSSIADGKLDKLESKIHRLSQNGTGHGPDLDNPEFPWHIENRNRRKAALEALHLTGDVVKDMKAFLQAAEVDKSLIPGPHREAIDGADRQGVLEYVCLLQKWRHPPIDQMTEADRDYWRTFHRVVDEIITAAEKAE